MGIKQQLQQKLRRYAEQQDFYQEILRERDELQSSHDHLQTLVDTRTSITDYTWFVPPGHFYSPLVDERSGDYSSLINLWNPQQQLIELPGVELNRKGQQAMLKRIAAYTQKLSDYVKRPDIRYRLDNDQFGKSDTSFLFLMLLAMQPKQIIEVGSGWSSALMLDVNEYLASSPAALTFIDPYPERLYSAIRPADTKHCRVITQKVQDVPVEQFQKLGDGDILFIDNSHVSKCGSDVNYLFFEVLPRLQRGVVIHVHDIFYPFEYPIQWVVEDKRNWNEAYLLRALLTGSAMFEIILWPSYLMALDRPELEGLVPTAVDLSASIWLRKAV